MQKYFQEHCSYFWPMSDFLAVVKYLTKLDEWKECFFLFQEGIVKFKTKICSLTFPVVPWHNKEKNYISLFL